MRVVILANASSPHTRRWASALARRSLDVHVLSIRDASIPGVMVHRVGVGGPQRRGRVTSLLSYLMLLVVARRRITRLRPDVVNAHYTVTHGMIAVLARCRPLVVTVWGSDAARGDRPVGGPKRWLNRFVLRRAAAVTTASQFLARITTTLGGESVVPRVVPFGVDTSAFRPAKGGERLIGFIKRFERRYDPVTLVRALAAMREPDWRLLMVGGGSLRAQLADEAQRLGIGDRVELRGPTPPDEVPAVMASLAILANPSASESFGVVNLEAAATGIPVVATRVGGTAETVVDGETGLLVPVGDAAAMAAALDTLAGDAALRDRMGSAGLRMVEERFDWERCVDSMIAVYRSVAP